MNEVVGAYFPAGARIQVYRYLDRLGERAIYCDTDSVIYIQPKNEPNLIQKRGKTERHDLRIAVQRVRLRVCEWWA